MTKKRIHKKPFIVSLVIIAAFVMLMIFSLKKDPSFVTSPLINQKAPFFTAQTVDGEFVKSEEIFNNKNWVVINFWSSFCYVCKNEAPEIESFYKYTRSQKKNNIFFLSVNIQDQKESIQKWQHAFGQTFPVLQDEKGFISIRYGVTGTPETFFINPQGIVKYKIAGAINKNFILDFIQWLEENPDGTLSDAAQAAFLIRSRP
jgi:cytochrome c biogenesis protein CcmG/thiol:disulfide interchange protein DsbE